MGLAFWILFSTWLYATSHHRALIPKRPTAFWRLSTHCFRVELWVLAYIIWLLQSRSPSQNRDTSLSRLCPCLYSSFSCFCMVRAWLLPQPDALVVFVFNLEVRSMISLSSCSISIRSGSTLPRPGSLSRSTSRCRTVCTGLLTLQLGAFLLLGIVEEASIQLQPLYISYPKLSLHTVSTCLAVSKLDNVTGFFS